MELIPWVISCVVMLGMMGFLVYTISIYRQDLKQKDEFIHQLINLTVFKAPMQLETPVEPDSKLDGYKDDETLQFIEELKKAAQP